MITSAPTDSYLVSRGYDCHDGHASGCGNCFPAPTDLEGAQRRRAPSRRPTGRTRISATWVAVVVATLVFVLLLIFILQNTEPVKVSYFTAHGTMPLGVVSSWPQ